MNTIFAIITRVIFQHEENYSNFLSSFEEEFGSIDNIIIRRCTNRKDEIILQVKLK